MLVVDQNKRFKTKYPIFIKDTDLNDFVPHVTTFHKDKESKYLLAIEEGEEVKLLGVNKDFKGCTIDYNNKYYELGHPATLMLVLDAETEIAYYESAITKHKDDIKRIDNTIEGLYEKIKIIKKEIVS